MGTNGNQNDGVPVGGVISEAGLRDAAEPIAIVGMGCRFPGAANLAGYWSLLRDGIDAIKEVPAERWDINDLFNPDPNVPGKIGSRFGGFLEKVDEFDAAFFGVSPREAPHVDPRQRVVLEVAWEALEDAGIPAEALAGSKTGVFLSTLTSDYDQILSRDTAVFQIYTGVGTANSIIANRISYFFDLRGPSISLDTACSGSLVTIDLACKSLRAGESNLALAGGVAINLLPNGDIFFSRAGSLSPDGRCHTFDSNANGIVRSEGAGIIILKRLSDAIASADRVYALIRGSAVNHDGHSNGIMAPNGEAQEAVLRDAYRSAGVAPGRVQYVEAHGTGTLVGDPIEVRALMNVLGVDRPSGFPCVLGSAKTNIGHTESAAGVAGVIKVALSLKHRLIPPNLHLKELNPLITASRFPVTVYQAAGQWPVPQETLIAGVSGFGFGGTNAHVVLQEFAPAELQRASTRPPWVLPLSAKNQEALEALAASHSAFLNADGALVPVQDICHTAGVRRSHHEHRLALTAQSREEFVEQLNAFVNNEELAPGASLGRQSRIERPRIVFMFSGQGSPYPGMGKRLLDEEPVFGDLMRECDAILGRQAGWSLLDLIDSGDRESELGLAESTQPVIFAFQISLAALWRSWGIEPDAIIGQSLGEVAAAHVSGALELEDAVRLVLHRSRLLDSVVGKGKTAIVGMRPGDMPALLKEFDGLIALAGSTGPASSVISGDTDAVRQLISRLKEREVFCRLLENVDAAVHSPQMDPLVGPLVEALGGMTPGPASVRFISTVTASEIAGQELTPDYWGRNLREPFRFWDGAQHLIEDGYDTFIEMSYHPVLTGALRQGFVQLGREGIAIGSLQRDKDERWAMLSSLGAVYAQGYPVEWRRLYPSGCQHVSLPCYPWQRERYWFDQLTKPASGAGLRLRGRRSGVHPLLGEHVSSALASAEHFWELDLSANTIHYLSGHAIQGTVLFPGAAYVEMALEAAKHISQDRRPAVEDITFERALILAADEVRRVQLVLSPISTGETAFQVFSKAIGPDDTPEPWTLHASGRIRWTGHGDEVPAASISLDEIKERCVEQTTGADHYRAMQVRGIEYGSSFQAVRGVWSRYGEALSRIELPQVCESEVDCYLIHPVILDAAFQGVAATLPATEGDTYLPQAIKRLRVFGPVGARSWCNVRLAPFLSGRKKHDARPGDPALTADLKLFDDAGKLLAEIDGLRLQRLDVTRQKVDQQPIELAYEVEWRAKPRDAVTNSVTDRRGHWVIFEDSSGIGRKLASSLEELGGRCVLVHPSDSFRSSADKREWWLRPDVADDFRQFFDDVLKGVGNELNRIVHLWGADNGSGEDPDLEDLERRLSCGCRAAVNIVQTLVKSEARPELRLWLVTRGVQPVGGRIESNTVFQAALWGLGRVIANEHPEIWGGLIDLDPGDSDDQFTSLLDELCCGGSDDQIAFRGNQRYVPRLIRLKQDDRTVQPIRFRGDASYLITGGLSGLGLQAARWMAQQGARRLILLTRAALPDRPSWNELAAGDPAAERVAAIKDLEMMGVSVHTAAVDVGDETRLSAFFDRYRLESYPPIRGVIHSAGLIQDQLLMNMEEPAFDSIVRPKLHAAWHLHRLTRGWELDFFVMFSSVSSLMGQIGQANYAAGNAFMDAFAYYRRTRGQPALSINWGPWSETGIFSRLGVIEEGRFPGVRAINPREGIEALSYLLEHGPAQSAVLAAEWPNVVPIPLISELAHERSDVPIQSDAEQPGKISMLELLLADAGERKAIIEAHLRETVAKILRLEPDRLKVSKPLTTLGMDSIMAVELKNRIEASLNLSVALVDLFTGSVSKLAERLASQLEGDKRIGEVLDEVERLPLEQLQAYFQQSEYVISEAEIESDEAAGRD